MKTKEDTLPIDAKLVREVENLIERLAIDIRLDAGDLLLTQEELERDLSYGRAH